MKNKKGFTLIEIMIVVVLIGILASIALIRFKTATDEAKLREPIIILKKMWEMEYTYYMANGNTITSDGVPIYYGVNTGDRDIDSDNEKKLFMMGLDEPSGVTRFYYVSTEEAITFAFPKKESSPFSFSDDEIDKGIQHLELAIDNDGRIYIYENGNVRELN